MPSSGLSRRLSLMVAVALVGVAIGGCDDGEDASATSPTQAESTDTKPATSPDPAKPAEERVPVPEAIEPPPCSPQVAGCVRAAGSILYVERVDPDGDGDAHFVLLSRDGVTAPGISTVDVSPELRPDPLPGPGDLLAASGPVFEGSFGQRQIQAEAIEFQRVP